MNITDAAEPMLPIDHPLAGCEAKYWRGHEHFELLNKEIRAKYAGKRKFVTFRGEIDPDDEDVFRYVVDEFDAPGLRFATIIGDIVSNARSALDHLVFELAFLGNGGQRMPFRPAFPNSDTRKNWDSKIVQNKLLAGVMQKHRTMLYRAQPCFRRQDAASDAAVKRRRPTPASDLDNLWNHDKHRMLQPPLIVPLTMHGKVIRADYCEIVGQPKIVREFLGRPLEKDAEALRFRIRRKGTNPYVHVNFDCTGDIWFSNRMAVLDSIAAISDWVGRVCASFQPEFETPKARKLWGVSRGGWLETTRPRGTVSIWSPEMTRRNAPSSPLIERPQGDA